MVPTAGPNGTQLTSITRAGTLVTPLTRSTIKGLEYATFTATSGSYSATYSAPAPLAMAAATASTEMTADAQTATIAWETNNVSTSKVLLGTSPDQLSESTVQEDSTRRHSLVVDELEAEDQVLLPGGFHRPQREGADPPSPERSAGDLYNCCV